MDAEEQNERLEAIVARFYTPKPHTILGSMQAPFDTSKPNIHESKADFLAEKAMVERAIAQTRSLVELLKVQYAAEEPNYQTAKRLFQFINVSVKQTDSGKTLETIEDMVRKNAREADFSFTLAMLMVDLWTGLNKRKQELDNQEAIFWSGKGRAPNHYARAIALRFAKLIARETGKRPTFGTSSDGSHPSTEFGRALEEVFEVLNIKVSLRHPARWAVKQITDEDLQPEPVNRLASFGLGSVLGTPPRENALTKISDALLKGS